MLTLALPLAANDPRGRWTIRVRELLSGTEGEAAFEYRPAAQCGALAGLEHRAVCFEQDWDNLYAFFRENREVLLVKGEGGGSDG